MSEVVPLKFNFDDDGNPSGIGELVSGIDEISAIYIPSSIVSRNLSSLDDVVITVEPVIGYTLQWLGDSWDASVNPAGVTDHGALAGLTDDDHAQYSRADGSRDVSGTQNFNIITTTGNANIGGSIAVTGNINVTGTVDGRDIAADGTNLDTHTASGSVHFVSSIITFSGLPDVNVSSQPTVGQVLLWEGDAWEASTNPAGVTDHGALTGLEDDDHVHYLRTDGTRSSTGTQTFGDVIVSASLGTSGNILVGGTVDGRDIDADGTTLDNISFSGLPDINLVGQPAIGEVLQWIGDDWQASSNPAGVTDHGALTGLDDDDHVHYLRTDGTRGSTGTQTFGDVLVSASLGTSGNILVGGTVDGRDIDADGTIQDTHIASGTVHYTEASIDHGSIAGLTDDDHVHYLRTDGTRSSTGPQTFGDLTVSTSLGVSSDINYRGNVSGIGNITTEGNLNVTGNINVTGNVDGRDINADGTTLDNIALSTLPDINIPSQPTIGFTLQWTGDSWEASTNPAGVTDHGALTGLDDDDHAHYLRTDGTRASTGTQIFGDVVVSATLGVSGGIRGDLEVCSLAGATYTNLQERLNTFQSAGWLTGGGFQDNGDGTINVSAGTGIIRATDSNIDTVYNFDWSASSSLPLANSSLNFVHVEYNSGSPQVVANTTFLDDDDFNTNVLLGSVYRTDNSLRITEEIRHVVGDHANIGLTRIKETDAFARASGALITEQGTRGFGITAGTFWEGLTKFSTGVFAASSDNFEYNYRDGGGGWVSVASQSQVNNTQYDDGTGALATLTATNYGTHWVFLNVDGSISVLYGRDDNSLLEAQNDIPSAYLPPWFEGHTILVGKIIILRDAATFTSIESSFGQIFTPSIATEHSELLGLTEDDHAHYLRTDGTRSSTGTQIFGDVVVSATIGTSGNMAVGGDISVTGTVDGRDIAADAAAFETHEVSGSVHFVSSIITFSSLPDTNIGSQPTTGQVLTWEGDSWEASTSPAGVTAHALLTGLDGDDHVHYLRTDGARSSTGLQIFGDAIVSASLGVSGDSSFGSTLSGTGAITTDGILNVSGRIHTAGAVSSAGSIIADVNIRARGNLNIEGNINVTGTVDGRDIAGDGSTQDTHIASGTVHYTEASIDHGAIAGLTDDDHAHYLRTDGTRGSTGTQTFGDVIVSSSLGTSGNILVGGTVDGRDIASDGTIQDTHIASGTVHYTESSIDHGSIAGLTDDDHGQYLRTDGTRDSTGTQVFTAINVTGNIAVTGTVDGRDIASDAAAFENHETSGSVHFVSSIITFSGLPDTNIGSQPTTGQVLTWEGDSWEASTSPAGVTDHALLTGLDGDDHVHYLRTDGTRSSTGPQTFGDVTVSTILGVSGESLFGDTLSGQGTFTTQGDINASGFIHVVGAVSSTGSIIAGTNLRALGNLNVEGNINVTGNVDGRNIASDGTTQDSHIGDSTLHFTEGSIDHGAIAGLTDDDHVHYLRTDGTRSSTGTQNFGDIIVSASLGTSGNILVGGTVDGRNIAGDGSTQDSHIGDSTLHFTEGSIDHGSIAGLTDDDHVHYLRTDGTRGSTGTQTFGDVLVSASLGTSGNILVGGTVDGRNIASDGTTQDSHIGDGTLHFTEGSIDHGSVAGLTDDDHIAYLRVDGTRSSTGTQIFGDVLVSATLGVSGGIETSGALSVASGLVISGSIGFPMASGNGGITVDWSRGNYQEIRIFTGDGQIEMTAPSMPGGYTLKISWDSNVALTFNDTIKWVGASSPTFSDNLNSIDIVTFVWDGSTYFGSAAIGFDI